MLKKIGKYLEGIVIAFAIIMMVMTVYDRVRSWRQVEEVYQMIDAYCDLNYTKFVSLEDDGTGEEGKVSFYIVDEGEDNLYFIETTVNELRLITRGEV